MCPFKQIEDTHCASVCREAGLQQGTGGPTDVAGVHFLRVVAKSPNKSLVTRDKSNEIKSKLAFYFGSQ